MLGSANSEWIFGVRVGCYSKVEYLEGDPSPSGIPLDKGKALQQKILLSLDAKLRARLLKCLREKSGLPKFEWDVAG